MVKANNTDSSSSGINSLTTSTATNRVSMKQSNTFPFRLHEMLDTVAQEGSESIVSWCAGNHTAFKVHKPQDFVKTIMPRFFQQTKYKSFQRQCNLWGYERILHGPEKGGYEHPEGFFVRGNHSLVNKMVRRKIKRPSSLDRTDAIPASSSSLEAINTPCPFNVTISPPASAIVAPQRRPSIVSCSSSNSGVITTTSSQCQGNYYAESSAGSLAPNTPLGSSYSASSAETSPCAVIPEGLHLPLPSAYSHCDTVEAAASTVVVDSDFAAAGDTLFFEGLSAFFEDDEVVDASSTVPPTPLMAPGIPQQYPALYQPPTNVVHHQQQRLQPKRRLSMELFVASRQQNSNELILDLLSESDTLQKSLEMELMCTLSSV
jgi:HSF-type DNA-binding